MEVHTSTKIGLSVNQVKKANETTNENISKKAKSLLSFWKKSSSSTGAAKAGSAPASAHEVTSLSGVVSSDAKKANSRSGGEERDRDRDSLHSLPESRKKMVEKFKQMFIDADATTNADVAGALAVSIEDAVDGISPFVKDNKAYLVKCRDFIFNLKRNEKLRLAVLQGQLQAQTLVRMASRDMATDEQKQVREVQTKYDLDATSSSFIRDNIARIEKENGIEMVEGQFGACRKCGGTRTTHFQKQMRSSDEPMTVFINCLQCGTQWRKG